MANNRMWLKNKRTNARILLAKYYPTTGWYCFHDDLNVKLDKMFEDNEHDYTQWGDNDWVIEYEIDAKENLKWVRDAKKV